ncbi:type VII secretion target [Amycolatopsis benzoatilytica]|uniref:type VII secretion target n=1 Tax=Amycolatopsis benzoatilytica TaxID=346045 RepID=UPI00036C8AD5|nr:type VII secretion target [Amycolatopsis benzoatilytica]
MTAGGFRVEPDDLMAHASHLDGLVDRLNTASQAADYAMSDDAYGLLCAFLPPIINPTGEKAKEAIGSAVEGVQATSDNVRTAAKSYQDGDEGESQPFKKVDAETDGALSVGDQMRNRFRVGGVQHSEA